MPFEFYNFLHVVGIMLMFSALGGALLRAVNSGEGGNLNLFIAVGHGVGWLLIFVSGFGMIAKLGIGFPLWSIVKMVLLLVFGAILIPIRKSPDKATLFWSLILILGILSAWLALYKPF